MGHGTLLLSMGCSENRLGCGEVGLSMTGLAPNLETVRWLQLALDMGSKVQVKVVEAKLVDQPEILAKAPRDIKKYEKAACRRMAKEFGWTIQTGTKKEKAR
jgi:hypothetical protein